LLKLLDDARALRDCDDPQIRRWAWIVLRLMGE
jgi:hypothetical protein